MMFQTIQTIYFLWGYDPGNMSVSVEHSLLLSSLFKLGHYCCSDFGKIWDVTYSWFCHYFTMQPALVSFGVSILVKIIHLTVCNLTSSYLCPVSALNWLKSTHYHNRHHHDVIMVIKGEQCRKDFWSGISRIDSVRVTKSFVEETFANCELAVLCCCCCCCCCCCSYCYCCCGFLCWELKCSVRMYLDKFLSPWTSTCLTLDPGIAPAWPWTQSLAEVFNSRDMAWTWSFSPRSFFGSRCMLGFPKKPCHWILSFCQTLYFSWIPNAWVRGRKKRTEVFAIKSLCKDPHSVHTNSTHCSMFAFGLHIF